MLLMHKSIAMIAATVIEPNKLDRFAVLVHVAVNEKESIGYKIIIRNILTSFFFKFTLADLSEVHRYNFLFLPESPFLQT